jgi:cell division septation protein DedD
MKLTHRIRTLIILTGTALLVALLLSLLPVLASAQAKAPTERIFAQKLVEATQAKHPEADEVGISTNTRRGCIGIASTDKGDIGEKCEKDDITPMQTGKPYVEKEKDGFDVSVPLHDSTGKIIGTLGVGFKPAAGQTEASVTEHARKIAAEMEAQIPSKAKLFERSE